MRGTLAETELTEHAARDMIRRYDFIQADCFSLAGVRAAAAELEAVRAYLDEHRRQRVASEREVQAAVRSLQRVEAMLREFEHEHRRAYAGALA